MMGDKIYNYADITKFRNKECLECDNGILTYTGSSPNGGWVAYYKCIVCGTKYNFTESDMGQTMPHLDSDA
jgi:hypothetical protein